MSSDNYSAFDEQITDNKQSSGEISVGYTPRRKYN